MNTQLTWRRVLVFVAVLLELLALVLAQRWLGTNDAKDAFAASVAGLAAFFAAAL